MRRWTTATALILAMATGLGACGGDEVSPLPAQARASTSPSPSPSPSLSVSPSPSASPPARRSASPSPALSPTCYGAVLYDLHLQETELFFLKSICFATGAILRIRSIGPGMLKVAPEALTSRSYEAGVHDIQFVRPGTVEITIPQDPGDDHVLTVVVR